MATRRQLRSDIILRVTGGKPSDDFEIDNRQIDFWLDNVRAALVQQKYDEKRTSLEDYAVEFLCVDLKNEKEECSCPLDRYYVDLPVSIMDVAGDSGIYRVETASGMPLARIRNNEVHRTNSLRYMTHRQYPTYYRVGERLYFQGGNKHFLKHGKINMILIPQDTVGVIGDDDDYPIGGDLVHALLLEVEKIARREIMTPDDDLNDGDGDSEIHNT